MWERKKGNKRHLFVWFQTKNGGKNVRAKILLQNRFEITVPSTIDISWVGAGKWSFFPPLWAVGVSPAPPPHCKTRWHLDKDRFLLSALIVYFPCHLPCHTPNKTRLFLVWKSYLYFYYLFLSFIFSSFLLSLPFVIESIDFQSLKLGGVVSRCQTLNRVRRIASKEGKLRTGTMLLIPFA